MAKVLIEKIHGLFDLKPLYEYIRTRADGVFRIEVVRVRKKRSGDQNGWLWGCIYPLMLDAMIDAGWEFTSCEQLHEYFKNLFTAEQVVNKETGEIVKFPSSTAEMDTVQFSSYCEQLRSYAREYLNCNIPDPDKFRKDNEKDS